jgi:hypothetical protein
MGGGEGRDTNDGDGATGESRVNNDFWGAAVDDAHDCRESLTRICEQVCEDLRSFYFVASACSNCCDSNYCIIALSSFWGYQERQGGRMKQSQLGVLREDPHDDIRVLLENYTGEFRVSSLPRSGQFSVLAL